MEQEEALEGPRSEAEVELSEEAVEVLVLVVPRSSFVAAYQYHTTERVGEVVVNIAREG